VKILRQVIRKELLQLRRDRKMIPVLIVAPIMQLIILGYAANLDVNRIPMLLVDRDHSKASRELADRFTGSGYFRLVDAPVGRKTIDSDLIEGTAKLALVIAEGYGKDAANGTSAEVQVLADGSEGNLSLLGLSYASAIVAERSGELTARRLTRMRAAARAGGGVLSPARASMEAAATSQRAAASSAITLSPPPPPGRAALVPRVWYNPDLRSRWFYVPAILAMVLMLTTMVLPSMAVVREKEIGTLEQIMVTPLRPWQLIVGKLFPFAVIGMITVLIITALAVHFFGVPLRGSLLLLLLVTALFLLTTLGLGLFASTLVRNQQQAMLVSIFLLQVPMIYLSGLIFPIDNMPRLIQYATYGIPLRYYNSVIRGIFLKGSGMDTLWPHAVVLLAYGVGILSVASLRFRKRLD